MKPTQEQVIAWAREVCMPFYYQTGEIAGLERLEQFAALAYEAGRKDEPLYATQTQREWVGLTDEDLSVCDEDGVILARYWEAKLKEKNA